MWDLVRPLLTSLRAEGFEVEWAQSTYERKFQRDGRARTRSESQLIFSIDLTLRRGDRDFWLEVKFADAQTLPSATPKLAADKVKFFKTAAAEADSWHLVPELGSQVMKPPSGFGSLVLCHGGWRLKCDDVVAEHFFQPRASTPVASAKRLAQKRAAQKSWKTRGARKKQRFWVRRGQELCA